MTDVAAIAAMTTSTRNITKDLESVRATKTHCRALWPVAIVSTGVAAVAVAAAAVAVVTRRSRVIP